MDPYAQYLDVPAQGYPNIPNMYFNTRTPDQSLINILHYIFSKKYNNDWEFGLEGVHGPTSAQWQKESEKPPPVLKQQIIDYLKAGLALAHKTLERITPLLALHYQYLRECQRFLDQHNEQSAEGETVIARIDLHDQQLEERKLYLNLYESESKSFIEFFTTLCISLELPQNYRTLCVQVIGPLQRSHDIVHRLTAAYYMKQMALQQLKKALKDRDIQIQFDPNIDLEN